MQLRKKPILLLEILIGLSIAGILLSFLFSFLTQSVKMEKKIHSLQMQGIFRQHLHMRLQDLFMTLRGSLYTEKEAFVCTFDNGIDPDPHYSGVVQGKVELDSQHQLRLTLFPLDEDLDDPVRFRQEVLLAQVEKCQFEFLSENKQTVYGKVLPVLSWTRTWEKEASELPSQVRLSVRLQDGLNLQFAFFSPTSTAIVTYREKRA